jgi:hypothetical protein
MTTKDQLIEAIGKKIAASQDACELLEEDAHEGGKGHIIADVRMESATEKLANALIVAAGEAGAMTALNSMSITDITAALESAMHNRPVSFGVGVK